MCSTQKRLKHSPRRGCPKCGRDGKVKNRRTHVTFVCICGVNIQGVDRVELYKKLDELRGSTWVGEESRTFGSR